MFDELYETQAAPAVAPTAVATTQAANIDLDKVDLTKIALAHFDASTAALKVAADKLTDVVHDLSTPGKLTEAKSLRQRLINAPLAEARKVEKGLAGKLNGARKAVGTELARIEGEFAVVEQSITPQISTREAEFEAERAEREAKEAERVAAHRAGIAKLAGYVGIAQGRTAAQIRTIVDGVAGIEIDPTAWEEFAVGAEVQRDETLASLRSLLEKTQAEEAVAAERERVRLENEAEAKRLADERAELAAQRAELQRQADEIAAARKAEADRIEAVAQQARDAEASERIRADREARAWEAAEALKKKGAEDHRLGESERMAAWVDDGKAISAIYAAPAASPPEASAADVSTPAADSLPITSFAPLSDVAAPAPAPLIDVVAPAPIAKAEAATMKLGDLNEILSPLTITAAGLELLGFTPAAMDRAAKLYRPSDLPLIVSALIDRLQRISAPIAA